MKANKILKHTHKEEVKQEPKNVLTREEVLIKKKLSDEQVMADKAILDAVDSDKIKKDVMLKKADELQKHLEYLQKRINELSQEFEGKRRLADSVNGSIAGAQAELSNVRKAIEEQNAKVMREITKKLAEVDASDKTLRALVIENEETSKKNRIESNALIEHRKNCDLQVYEMKKALAQNQSEWNKREADILRREDELKDERKAFEEEKRALEPEAKRISAIKNENLLLVQKIERDRLDVEKLHKALQSEKDRIREDNVSSNTMIQGLEQSLKNEEARLRRWEENLKDYDLEIKAKSAEADKILRRAQLQKEVDSAKNK